MNIRFWDAINRVSGAVCATWYGGRAVPMIPARGQAGDFWLDIESGVLYRKIGTIAWQGWRRVCSMPSGNSGEPGRSSATLETRP